ncbi:PilZ domain-containing protein [bacterium]|nr:PilZ domain-containing protein [bacterium]
MFNERRDFFRIEADVLLQYQPIDESAAISNLIPPQFQENANYSLMQEIQQIEHDNLSQLQQISEEYSGIALYLKGLNKKIDAIATHFAQSLAPASDQKEKRISISEGGMAFKSSRKHPHDSFLAFNMSLLPLHQNLVIFGKVINCSETHDGFRVAISFIRLSDASRQIITKHIMQQQLEVRRTAEGE